MVAVRTMVAIRTRVDEGAVVSHVMVVVGHMMDVVGLMMDVVDHMIGRVQEDPTIIGVPLAIEVTSVNLLLILLLQISL